MALPTTRKEHKEWCLRKLGFPVIEINVADEQLEDRIDEALQYYTDYHFDATEKLYYKYKLTAADHPTALKSVYIKNGGTGYSNGASISFSGSSTNTAVATITTNGSGTITGVTFTNNGLGYYEPPTLSVSGGTGAELIAEKGGWVELPENVMGVVNLFDMQSGMNTSSTDMFNIQYQIYLNDVWTFMSSSMVPYYMTMQHLALLQEILVGRQPIRYNRHRNRLHLDMHPDKFIPNNYIIAEAYQVVDPDQFRDVWKDRWLLRYTTVLFKLQFGTHLSKYQDMPLPSGLRFNGDKIVEQAEAEKAKLEEEMINSYSIPVSDMIG